MLASKPRYATDFERGTRSYTMSQIRGKDTGPERIVRSYLFSRGLRFRKNDKRYPGHPDVVLPKYHAIIFVNGCFWHLHEGCPPSASAPIERGLLDGEADAQQEARHAAAGAIARTGMDGARRLGVRAGSRSPAGDAGETVRADCARRTEEKLDPAGVSAVSRRRRCCPYHRNRRRGTPS